ncbi:alpha/beta fold hydrolase [Nocardiopsis sp. ATB16-24]|uniref:thioesterase II family protein n=1 Tax=Nocardiopsis sp. ATB16-24 TaxID=3019555 RepID=UPI0025530C72|nr:alpha/beta fold hydrolase [Nocardiopsis sp. ATB16-24]
MDSIPVVCFPHAGAGRFYYSPWQHAFSSLVNLQVVQYPLREQRMHTPMPASVGELAEDVFAEFEDVFRGPYAIWGHSMGSVIGYEVAKLCQERLGGPPLTFFSSGSAAPCRARFTRAEDLDTPEGFRDVLMHYGGVPEEYLRDADYMKYFAPVIKADLRLLGSYQDLVRVPLRCPIVLMLGRDDTVTADQWEHYTAHPLDVNEYDGGHFFLDRHRTAMASLMELKIQLSWQLGEAHTVAGTSGRPEGEAR